MTGFLPGSSGNFARDELGTVCYAYFMKRGKKHSHVYDFLKHHHVGVLSTVTADGKPWGSAIYFVADEDFNIYFVTRKETFKYQNLDKTPFAALTVTNEQNQTTVQLAGTISRIPAEDYMKIVFDELYKSIQPKDDFNWAPPLEKIHKGDYMPLRITPEKLHFADFSKQSTDIDHKYIEEII